MCSRFYYFATHFCIFILILFYPTYSDCKPYSPVITENEERDLEFDPSPSKSHQGTLAPFDKTYTISGKKRLMHHLKNPTPDIALIQLRQKQLKLLLENPSLLEKTKKLLTRVKEAEQDILYFINNQEDHVAHIVISTFYFTNSFVKSLNKHSIALDMRNHLKRLGLFSPVIEHLIFHFGLSSIQEKITPSTAYHHHHSHNHVCDHDAETDGLPSLVHINPPHHNHGHSHGEHGHFCIQDYFTPRPGSSLLINGAFTALKGAHLGMHLMSIKEMCQQMSSELAVINKLYKQVSTVKSGLNAIFRLNNLMQVNNYASEAFDTSHALEINSSHFKQKTTIFTPIIHNTYFNRKRSLGYFSRIGNTLCSYQFLKENADALQNYMMGIADLDALVSIAEWYKEQITKKVPVCFVNFISGSQAPIIKLKDAWHVGLNPSMAISSDIELNIDKKPNKWIITGPNKTGKSSIIKQVGLNIVLAQTYGIAAADQAELTPFHKLISYIAISDDIAKDRSTFLAELLRAEECVHILQSLSPQQYACLLVDDSLLKSTSPDKSLEISRQFLTTIGAFPNSCALIVTQQTELTQLEKEKPGIFKNYRIKMNTDAQGNTKSLFRLEEGIGDKSAVLDVIKKQHSISFLDN